MEANFFRFFFQELGPLLVGKRVEKVYEPSPNLINLKCGTRVFLLVLPSPKRGAIFLTSAKPDNPQSPSTRAQWLRKRLRNRKLLQCRISWPSRKAAFELSPGPGKWLVLDLKQGVDLVDDLDSDFDRETIWPGLEAILSRERIYSEHPQLSPFLRKTLKSLPSEQAQALLSTLQDNDPETFSVFWKGGHVIGVVPWKIPQTQEVENTETFSSPLAAAERYGWSLLRETLDPQAVQDRLQKKAIRRIEKNLARLQHDEERMVRFCAEKEPAELLQSRLYALDRHDKKHRVEIQTPDGERKSIPLNPEFSLLENMELMFKRSQKGRRGLQHVQKRRSELKEQLQGLKRLEIDPAAWAKPEQQNPKASLGKSPQRMQGVSLHVFESSEGFTILRGKNQKANHRLLTQVAKPFDYWFHAQDGPGAHVLLKRAHSRQEVPRQSLLEAAGVAAAAGHQAQAKKAKVMCALVKDVRTMKGSPAGTVRVEQIMESFLVERHRDIDRELKKIR